MQNAPDQATTHARTIAQAPALSRVALALLASPPVPGTPEPYTLAKHVTNYVPGTKRVPQFVQVRDGHVTRCGVIHDMWTTPDGVDLWIVNLLDGGRMHAAPKRIAQCSGLDGRCTCAGEVRQ